MLGGVSPRQEAPAHSLRAAGARPWVALKLLQMGRPPSAGRLLLICRRRIGCQGRPPPADLAPCHLQLLRSVDLLTEGIGERCQLISNKYWGLGNSFA